MPYAYGLLISEFLFLKIIKDFYRCTFFESELTKCTDEARTALKETENNYFVRKRRVPTRVIPELCGHHVVKVRLIMYCL